MSDIKLATLICARHIVGVRSDLEVPPRFLGYFRYRRGFLILTVRYSLPAGLVRWLLSLWAVDPHSLWLEWFGTLKSYLKAVPAGLLKSDEENYVPTTVLDDG